jgi:hypothetical protein
MMPDVSTVYWATVGFLAIVYGIFWVIWRRQDAQVTKRFIEQHCGDRWISSSDPPYNPILIYQEANGRVESISLLQALRERKHWHRLHKKSPLDGRWILRVELEGDDPDWFYYTNRPGWRIDNRQSHLFQWGDPNGGGCLVLLDRHGKTLSVESELLFTELNRVMNHSCVASYLSTEYVRLWIAAMESLKGQHKSPQMKVLRENLGFLDLLYQGKHRLDPQELFVDHKITEETAVAASPA